jgi:hypothetical protein
VKNRPQPAARKKVVAVLADRTTRRGYADPATLGAGGRLELLSEQGTREEIPLDRLRAVYFVRDFSEPHEPERKTFGSRPKLAGLWVRVRFRDDGETLEGVIENNLLELAGGGVLLTPPDLRGTSSRIFIPAASLAELSVLGVNGIARRPSRPRPAPPPDLQRKLFGE